MSSQEMSYELDTIAVTPDQRFIMGGGGNYRDHPGLILSWDFESGSLVRQFEWPHYVLSSIVVTPDNRLVVISGREDRYYHDGTHHVGTIDLETGTYRGIKSWDHGSLKLSFTWDKRFLKFDDFLWDWQTGGDPILQQRNKEWLEQTRGKIELSANHFLSTNDETFVIEDFETGQTIRKFSAGHNNRHHKFSTIKITPDGRYLLSQRGSFDFKKTSQDTILSMWDMQTGELITSFESCRGTIKAIDITADSQYAVVLAYDPDSVIRVINLQTGELTLEIYPELIDKQAGR